MRPRIWRMDYCEYEDGELEEIAEKPEDEDTPPWEEDTEE